MGTIATMERVDPAEATPALPMYVQIRKARFLFTSYEDASKAYRATIDRLDLGGSATPPCTIHAADGREVAHVAYNGRVFETRTDGDWKKQRILFEAWSPEGVARAKAEGWY